jgi:pimeloyl-ACP methyl ester carboxylesterase
VLRATANMISLRQLSTRIASNGTPAPSAMPRISSMASGAKLSIYEGIGHAPFYEDATRFNSELTAFVREANKTN